MRAPTLYYSLVNAKCNVKNNCNIAIAFRRSLSCHTYVKHAYLVKVYDVYSLLADVICRSYFISPDIAVAFFEQCIIVNRDLWIYIADY